MIPTKLLSSLSFTIFIELPISLIFGYRRKKEMLSIILVNVITNLPLNFLFLSNNYFDFLHINSLTILLIEAIVVLVEFALLYHVFEEKPFKIFLLSIVMNISSYCIGVFLL